MSLLPSIKNEARVAFRGEPAELRQELISEVVANCWIAFMSLIRRGLEDGIYPKPLARYAIRQGRSGRRVGIKANINDITSRHCQIRKGVRIAGLDHYDREEGAWKEVVVESKKSGPAEVACIRLDFEAWLDILRPRQRRIAKLLATGESTRTTAKRFKVSSGRVSQIRRVFPQGIIFQAEPQRLWADRILAKPIPEEAKKTNFTPTFDEREYQKWVGTYRDLPEKIITELAHGDGKANRRQQRQSLERRVIRHNRDWGGLRCAWQAANRFKGAIPVPLAIAS